MVAFKLGIGKEGNGLLQIVLGNAGPYNEKPRVAANCCCQGTITQDVEH